MQNKLYDIDLHQNPFICFLVVISLYLDTHTHIHSESPVTPLLPPFLPHRNTLAQLKDAYTKLFEDYNELKEEKKKREVSFCFIMRSLFCF